MSIIQSRRPEKKAKNRVALTWKFPWTSCFTTHLSFLRSNSKILKAFPKTFPTKLKPCKCPTKKKTRQEKRKKRRREKAKRKRQLEDCFLHMPELRMLRFCIWLFIGRQWPENGSASVFRQNGLGVVACRSICSQVVFLSVWSIILWMCSLTDWSQSDLIRILLFVYRPWKSLRRPNLCRM